VLPRRLFLSPTPSGKRNSQNGRSCPIIRAMPTVLLVRHGQASFGGEDYEVLSEAGHRQAEVVAASLTERGYPALVTYR
jgi:hypothetical protein